MLNRLIRKSLLCSIGWSTPLCHSANKQYAYSLPLVFIADSIHAGNLAPTSADLLLQVMSVRQSLVLALDAHKRKPADSRLADTMAMQIEVLDRALQVSVPVNLPKRSLHSSESTSAGQSKRARLERPQ